MTAPAEAQLLDLLRAAVNRHHRRRQRARAVFALSFATFVVAGSSLAAVGKLPWWQTGTAAVDPAAVASLAQESLPATVDVSRARTVATDGDAALVAAPIQRTGYCLIPAWKGHASFGSQCTYQVTDPNAGRDDYVEAASLPAGAPGGPAWIVYGRLTESSAASIDLGAFSMVLENGGFFVANVPQELWSKLDATANRSEIVTASGARSFAGCVDWGASPDDPLSGKSGTHISLWRSSEDGQCKPQPILTPPTLILAQAQKLFDVTLLNDYSGHKAGQTIGFWDAPTSRISEHCAFPGPVAAPDPRYRHATGNCWSTSQRWAKGKPVTIGLGAQLVHVHHIPLYVWTASGWVDPSAGITRLTLESSAGSHAVSFRSGFFFVQIPGTSATADTPPTGGFTLVAYDATGHRVSSTNLDDYMKRLRP
jgi:hypothetical protein